MTGLIDIISVALVMWRASSSNLGLIVVRCWIRWVEYMPVGLDDIKPIPLVALYSLLKGI